MQNVVINPLAGLPDLHFNMLNQASADESSEGPLSTSFEPWNSLGENTQFTEGGTAMDQSLLSTPTSSDLRTEQDNQFLMFPMDESPIPKASPNNSSTYTTQPPKSTIGRERSTARNNKRKRGRQDLSKRQRKPNFDT